jgi:protein CpxP
MTTQTTPVPQAPNSRRRLGLVFLALPLLIGAASFSIARAHGPGGGGGGGEMGEFMQWRVQRMLDAIGATDAQKAQIKAAFEAQRPQQKALREERQKLRQQMEQALTAPTIDKAAIEQLRRQSVQLMDKGSTLFTQGVVSAAQVLTVAQRKELVEQMHQHRGGHGHHDSE